MMDFLAWFAMFASIIKAVTFPLATDLRQAMYEDSGPFYVRWVRVAGEALIITLLALRVLGKI